MVVYWILILIPALFALHPVRFNYGARILAFWAIGLLFSLLIGLRNEVGGDWDRYISIYAHHYGSELDFEKFTSGDYGYETIHWFSLNYLNGVYSTNLISAIIFMAGLLRFCIKMPMPWIALFVSVGFLVIVVSMGYTRQAVAIGFLLWGLVDLMNGKTKSFYISILLGTLFHKTVLIMILFGYFYKHKVSLVNIIFVSVIISAIAYFVFFNRVEHMYYYYIETKFHDSKGAFVRVFISFISVLIFFAYREKFREKFNDERLWYLFSLGIVALLPLSYFYSTFSDRVAIYLLPIQMVVLSRVPVLINSVYNRTIFVVAVIFSYISFLFAWLVFGKHSDKWLPYDNLLF